VMYYTRDTDGAEAFAVPLTITNRGARDAVVTVLDLRVSQAKAAATVTHFVGTYIGAGGNLAKDKQPFTPLSIPGRGAYAGLVIFHPDDVGDQKRRPQPVVADGVDEAYRFCLSAQSEGGSHIPLLDTVFGAPAAAISFEARIPWAAARTF